MNWSDIVGHDNIVARLRHLADRNSLPHAYLFVGPEGVGKFTAAKVFAAGLLCLADAGRPCGSCESCRRLKAGVHPDLMIICPDGALIKIDQVREVKRQASLMPQLSGRRVALFDGADKLTVEAGNSLLKFLEEPVGETVFILTAVGKQQLLDTIVSRTQVIPFYPLPPAVLADRLAMMGVPKDKAVTAARLSGGRLGTALGLTGTEGLSARDRAAKIVFELPFYSAEQILKAAGEFGELERADVLDILRYLEIILRDILMILAGQDDGLVYNVDHIEEFKSQAGHWTEKRLTDALRHVKLTRRAVSLNAGIRLSLEALLIKLRYQAGEDFLGADSSWRAI